METKENRKDFFVVGAIIALVVCLIAAAVVTVTVIWLSIPTRSPEQRPVKDPEQRPQASVGGGTTNPENSADPQVDEDPMKNATVYHFVDKNVRSLSMRVSANKTELLLLAYGIGQLPADGISEDGEKISDISGNEWLKELDPKNDPELNSDAIKYVNTAVTKFLEYYRYDEIEGVYGLLLTDGRFVSRFKFDGENFEVIPGYVLREDLLPAPTADPHHNVAAPDPAIANDPPADNSFDPASVN